MKASLLAVACVATALSACQTIENGGSRSSVMTCSDARLKAKALTTEHEAFNRKIIRAGGRGSVRSGQTTGLTEAEASRRQIVMRELGELNTFIDVNRCPVDRQRRELM